MNWIASVTCGECWYVFYTYKMEMRTGTIHTLNINEPYCPRCRSYVRRVEIKEYREVTIIESDLSESEIQW